MTNIRLGIDSREGILPPPLMGSQGTAGPQDEKDKSEDEDDKMEVKKRLTPPTPQVVAYRWTRYNTPTPILFFTVLF